MSICLQLVGADWDQRGLPHSTLFSQGKAKMGETLSSLELGLTSGAAAPDSQFVPLGTPSQDSAQAYSSYSSKRRTAKTADEWQHQNVASEHASVNGQR